MNRTAVFEAAGQLSNWVANLSRTTKSSLLQAEDVLCRKHEHLPGDLPDKAILRLLLGAIGDRIEEVMYAFDKLCQAAGRTPPFESALEFLEDPPPVQGEARQSVEGKPAGYRHRPAP